MLCQPLPYLKPDQSLAMLWEWLKIKGDPTTLSAVVVAAHLACVLLQLLWKGEEEIDPGL